ncbi:MAG TPA: hypothetical protein VFI31_09400 [Pirellulales bacterium]|nr:hypothetical protein [Pirellulales bacterium]
MQSSAVVALRTMIMIVCLVAVPLAAVLGTALPKVVKSAFGHTETRPPMLNAESDFSVRETAQVVPVDNVETAVVKAVSSVPGTPVEQPLEAALLPRARIVGVRSMDDGLSAVSNAIVSEPPPTETAPLWNPTPRTASTPGDRPMTTLRTPSTLRQTDAEMSRKSGGAGRQTAYETRQRANRRDDALQKTVYSPPVPGDEEPLPSETAEGGVPAVDGLTPVERVSNGGVLADGEQRLRQLGAVYYRLEMWGNDGAFYRCSCSVPLSARGRAVRHFESIEAAPSQAIEAVIKQVESWRAKRAGS